jgi:hypothetical protein
MEETSDDGWSVSKISPLLLVPDRGRFETDPGKVDTGIHEQTL